MKFEYNGMKCSSNGGKFAHLLGPRAENGLAKTGQIQPKIDQNDGGYAQNDGLYAHDYGGLCTK